MLPHDKVDFPRMLRGIRGLVGRQLSAESVVASVANTLARARFPLLPKLSGGTRVLSGRTPVSSFAEWLMQMDLKDAGFWLSSAYSHLVTADRRRKRAMFFTPPILGERLLDNMEKSGVNWTKVNMIDLACGGAAFLAPAARRMANALTL